METTRPGASALAMYAVAALRFLSRPSEASSGLATVRHCVRWLVLGGCIGLAGGVGAVLLNLSLGWMTHVFLGVVVDYMPPSPAGEGITAILPIGRPWLLPCIVALGGLLAGLIGHLLGVNGEGHGTDVAIVAIHQRRGQIRARTPLMTLLGSSVTIGSGGSAGRGGPAAQISAGFGSLLGRWLGLGPDDQRIAVAAGLAAGFGAIFRAPLGGALVAAEILYVRDVETRAIFPSVVAALVSHGVYGTYFGFGALLGEQPDLALGSPIQLLYYGGLGVVSGLLGRLLIWTFHGVGSFFRSLRLPVWLKPAIGGLAVGSLGLFMPGVLHVGYGWVQIAMSPMLLDLPLWMVVLLPLAKILATSMSIGSGGSGGIFGPGLVTGGLVGGSFWRLTHQILPEMTDNSAPFVIVGMMALFGSVAHAPLGMIVMVSEMTGNLGLIVPAAVAVTLAHLAVGRATIFDGQRMDRAGAPGQD